MSIVYMSSCEHGKEEAYVIYESGNCPLCEALERISELESVLEVLEEQIAKHEAITGE